MNKKEVIESLKYKSFKKLTGPPEHWLTTFNTKFWGLESKYEKVWDKLEVGDLFIFHSTAIEYLDSKPRLPTGVIGISIVSGITRKEGLEWIGEIKTGQNRWPLLIHFSEIWWFGKYEEIADESIRQKISYGEKAIIEDLKRLTHNCLIFEEMRKHNCVIPAQGSIQNISVNRKERLIKLFSNRFKDAVISEIVLEQERREVLPIKSEEDILPNIFRRIRLLRNIDLSETDEKETERQRKQIIYERNQEAQERASKSHRETLGILANEILKRKIKPLEGVMDLYVENKGKIFLLEIKTIHTNNVRNQTRKAIGQLLEYEYFDIISKAENVDKSIFRGIVYNKEPPREIVEFLRNYNFEVFWLDKEKTLTGHQKSKEMLNDFLRA